MMDLTMSEPSEPSTGEDAIAEATVEYLIMMKTLGVGTFGSVQLCRLANLDNPFAVKIMCKSKLVKYGLVENVINERKIMMEIKGRHPFVTQLYRTFADEGYIYMLQEFVPGGDLYLHLHSMHSFPKAVVQFYTAQIVLAFEFLHSVMILFGDLKPENVLISSSGYLKLADFGFARQFTPGNKCHTTCGTAEYLAPEVICNEGAYSYEVDWWALGILIFEMVCGRTPFCANTPQETYHKILSGLVLFPLEVDDMTRDIVMRLLVLEPSQRLGCFSAGTTIKSHHFFQDMRWDMLEASQIPAPLVPQLDSPYCTRYFDEFSSEESQLPPAERLTESQQEEFFVF